jgi:hypothetical protein
MSLLPPPEAIYPDPATAFTAIQLHAKAHGYALIKHLQRPTRVVFTCDRAGKYRSASQYRATHESKQRKGTGIKKCECLMKVELRLDNLSSQWILYILEPAHNHPPSAAPTAHPAHRIAALLPDIRAEITKLAQAGLSTSQILTTLRISNSELPLIAKDIGNIVQQMRSEQLNGRTPIQWLLEVRIKTSF